MHSSIASSCVNWDAHILRLGELVFVIKFPLFCKQALLSHICSLMASILTFICVGRRNAERIITNRNSRLLKRINLQQLNINPYRLSSKWEKIYIFQCNSLAFWKESLQRWSNFDACETHSDIQTSHALKFDHRWSSLISLFHRAKLLLFN